MADFCQKEVAPLAESTDKNNEFPMHLWEKFGEMGLLGLVWVRVRGPARHGLGRGRGEGNLLMGLTRRITAPEEFGGLGKGYLDHTVVMEEMSRASGSIALSYGAQ